MKRKNEKVPGFDEIIFENRNKEYGAFDLRKHYLPATCFSILGAVSLVTILVFIISFTVERDVKARTGKDLVVIIKPDPFIQDPNKLKLPEPVKLKVDNNLERYLAPIIVEKVDSTDKTLAAASALDSIKDKPVDPDIVVVTNPDPVVPVEPEPAIYVEEMPSFPGGDEALLKFISRTIKYPEDAVENNMEGKVLLRFVVSSDGSVKRVEIIKGVHPVLDQEAIRVVSLLPKWKPGKQNGKAVPVWFSVPVTFRLTRN